MGARRVQSYLLTELLAFWVFFSGKAIPNTTNGTAIGLPSFTAVRGD